MKIIKKTVSIFLIFLIVFFIYIFNVDKKINYLSLGDSLAIGINSFGIKDLGYSDNIANYLKEKKKLKSYIVEYSEPNYTIPELINDIKLNKKIRKDNMEIGIKKSISEADLITLSIGNNEIIKSISINLENNNYDKLYLDINVIIKDLDNLVDLIRKYNKKKIIIIGYYYPQNKDTDKIKSISKYIQFKLMQLKEKNNVEYVDTELLLKDKNTFFLNTNNIYPNKDGYRVIANKIIKTIKE